MTKWYLALYVDCVPCAGYEYEDVTNIMEAADRSQLQRDSDLRSIILKRKAASGMLVSVDELQVLELHREFTVSG